MLSVAVTKGNSRKVKLSCPLAPVIEETIADQFKSYFQFSRPELS